MHIELCGVLELALDAIAEDGVAAGSHQVLRSAALTIRLLMTLLTPETAEQTDAAAIF